MNEIVAKAAMDESGPVWRMLLVVMEADMTVAHQAAVGDAKADEAMAACKEEVCTLLEAVVAVEWREEEEASQEGLMVAVATVDCLEEVGGGVGNVMVVGSTEGYSEEEGASAQIRQPELWPDSATRSDDERWLPSIDDTRGRQLGQEYRAPHWH